MTKQYMSQQAVFLVKATLQMSSVTLCGYVRAEKIHATCLIYNNPS